MLTRTKTRILFGSALLLFFLSAASAFVAIARLLDAEKWVTHTRDVQIALAQVNTVTTRAARTRTEYINSGDPERLRDHQAAIAQVPETLRSVKTLIADNPPQQERERSLEKLAGQRLALFQQSIALRQSGQTSLEKQAAIAQAGVAVGSEMDSLTQEMQEEEQDLLEERVAQRERSGRLAAGLLALTFVVAGLLFVVDYRLLNRELEARQEAQASLQKLSARILNLQDEERRKFSRDLHDSMGQLLASVKMNLDLLAQSNLDNAALANCSELLDQALRETRTISYLLHPPLLDQAGFEIAAKEYVEGFSKRSGIPVTLEMPEPMDRLAAPIELALYRVLQESLTNIHKHSGCSQAMIAVKLSPAKVSMSIRDNGKGIAPAVLKGFRGNGTHLGVGVAGMRERLRELGGQLDIDSDSIGAIVTATLPRTKGDSARPQKNDLAPLV
jgi:signal transduction histidine kinase